MKPDIIEILSSPSKDPEFPKKYVITLLASFLSVLLVPAVLLIGYLAETVKHASLGKKDLPPWKDFMALTVQGGASILTGLYLLPAAILFAISVVTASSIGGSTLFGVSILTAFISLSGMLIGFVGLALSATAVHTYIHSDNFTDLFHIPKILKKLKGALSDIGYLFGSIGLITLGASILCNWLGWLGPVVLTGLSAFLSLALALGVGTIYGAEEEVSDSTPVKALEDRESAEEVAENTWDVDEKGLENDVWKPK